MSSSTQAVTFHAVIFDLDGVLTDTAEFHFQAWRQLAAELGIHIDTQFNETLKGVSRMASLERILAQGARTVGTPAFSDAKKQQLAERKNNHYRQLIARMSPRDVLPGTLDVLDFLRAEGIPLGLASASRNAPTILRQLNLQPYFTAIADPATVRGKPHPDLFLAAAQALHMEPRHCLGVEDAQAGIAAIRAAGMYALGIGEAQHLSAADEVIPSLAAFQPRRYRWRRR